VDREHFITDPRPALWIDFLEGAAYHHADQLILIDRIAPYRPDDFAVPEDGDTIGNLEDLLEPVRDVQDERLL